MQTVDRTIQPSSQRAKRIRGPRTPAEKARRTLERREARKKREREEKEARKGKHKHGKGSDRLVMACVICKEPFSSNQNFAPPLQIHIHYLKRQKDPSHLARMPLRIQLALRDKPGFSPRTPAETVSVPCFLQLGFRSVPRNPRSLRAWPRSDRSLWGNLLGEYSGEPALAVFSSGSYFRILRSQRLPLVPVPLGRAWTTKTLLPSSNLKHF